MYFPRRNYNDSRAALSREDFIGFAVIETQKYNFMKNTLKLTVLSVLSAGILLVFSGCGSVPQFASYRPPGEEKNLGIEISKKSAGLMTQAFELRINGEFVAECKTTFDYHPSASGTYKGRKVEMNVHYRPIEKEFYADVIIDGERAARLTLRN